MRLRNEVSMKENLPSLDVDRYKILLYTKSSSSTESFNDFLEDNSHLYIHRLDSNKIEIETNKLDNFIDNFENYINNRDKNISTIIKELSNEPQITNKFDSLLEYEWLLNNTRYSRLYIDDSNNKLYYRRGANKVINYIEDPLLLLTNKKSRKINERNGKVRTLKFENQTYTVE